MTTFNYITATDWAVHLTYIKEHGAEENHDLLASQGKDLFRLSKANLKHATKLNTATIFEITTKILDQEQYDKPNVTELQDAERMLLGLTAILDRRKLKFKQLGCICRFFASLFGEERKLTVLQYKWDDLNERYNQGKDAYDRKIADELQKEQDRKTRHEQAEQKRQAAEQRREATFNRLYREAEKSFSDSNGIDLTEYDDLHPHQVEQIADLLYAKFNTSEENRTTLFLLYEKVAERFLAQNNGAEALRVRVKATETLPCSNGFANIHAHVRANAQAPFRCKVSPLGTTVLKNHILHCSIANDGRTLMEGRLNHYARKKLNSILKDLVKQRHFGQEITFDRERGVINFKGMGRIVIGTHEGDYGSYFRLSITIDATVPPEKVGEHAYRMLAILGLGDIAHAIRPIDIERIKIFQLFRAYFPVEALKFERSQNAFETPLTTLKDRMIVESSSHASDKAKVKAIFDRHLSTMYQQEIYPGYSIWAVRDLSKEIASEGGIGLMVGVGCAYLDERGREVLHPFPKSAEDLVSMLKYGILSTEDRQLYGINEKAGVSPGKDSYLGGGDSVFTRLVLNTWLKRENAKFPIKIKAFGFHGHFQVLLDPKLLDRVGYGLEGDCYGAKTTHPFFGINPYHRRKNLVELTKHLHDKYSGEHRNEICIKSRIPPEYISGVQVATIEHKEHLVGLFKKNGLVTTDGGVQKINGIPLEQFIHVGEYFTPASFHLPN